MTQHYNFGVELKRKGKLLAAERKHLIALLRRERKRPLGKVNMQKISELVAAAEQLKVSL
jgi:hypothetical protein